MNTMIDIQHLKVSIEQKEILKDISLSIPASTFTSIIGSNGSGKSTLFKAILGQISIQGSIVIDHIKLDKTTRNSILKKIGYVSFITETNFLSETVKSELSYALYNIGFPKEKIDQKIQTIVSQFHLLNKLEENPYTLSNHDKQLLALSIALITEPKILLLDEPFTEMNDTEREELFSILKQYVAQGMTICMITHNMEDLLYTDYIAILDEGKLIVYHTQNFIWNQSKLFINLGLRMPFLVELSIKLKYYGLVEEIPPNQEVLVNQIWK